MKLRKKQLFLDLELPCGSASDTDDGETSSGSWETETCSEVEQKTDDTSDEPSESADEGHSQASSSSSSCTSSSTPVGLTMEDSIQPTAVSLHMDAPLRQIDRVLCQCWMCFEEGFAEEEVELNSTFLSASSAQAANGSGYSSNTQTLGQPQADDDNVAAGLAGVCDALLAPCAVCCGTLQYVHHSCLARWLHQSWSPNCPNCARPLIRSILESTPAGKVLGTLLDGLHAACTQAAEYGADMPGQPLTATTNAKVYPRGSFVSFALGSCNGQVHVDLPCSHLTVTAVAQQISAIASEVMQESDDGSSSSADSPKDLCSSLTGLRTTVTVLPPHSSVYGNDLIPGVAYATYVRPQDLEHVPQSARSLESPSDGTGADALVLWQRLLRRRGGSGVYPPAGEAPAPQREALSEFDRSWSSLAHDWEESDAIERLEQQAEILRGSMWGMPYLWREVIHRPLDPTLVMRVPQMPTLPDTPPRPITGSRNLWAHQQLGQPGQARALTTELQRALYGGGGSTANGPRWAGVAHQEQRLPSRYQLQHQQRCRPSGRRRC